MAVPAASILLGLTSPTPILALQGMVPIVLAPAWVIGAVAFRRRRWIVGAVCGVLVIAQLWWIVPAATADGPPAWASGAPHFTLYSGNVRYDNDRKGDVAAELMGVHAEVVVLNEMMPDQRELLERAGFMQRYSTVVASDPSGTFGEMILTSLPVLDHRVIAVGSVRVPEITVRVGTRRVRILVAHPRSPEAASWSDPRWERDQAALHRVAVSEAMRGPLVIAGDFNATRWQRPFDDLLDDGFSDAHDVLGDGLSRSWGPLELGGFGGKLIRLDHCLTTPGVTATEIGDLDLPGSDHVPFQVTLAVR